MSLVNVLHVIRSLRAARVAFAEMGNIGCVNHTACTDILRSIVGAWQSMFAFKPSMQ